MPPRRPRSSERLGAVPVGKSLNLSGAKTCGTSTQKVASCSPPWLSWGHPCMHSTRYTPVSLSPHFNLRYNSASLVRTGLHEAQVEECRWSPASFGHSRRQLLLAAYDPTRHISLAQSRCPVRRIAPRHLGQTGSQPGTISN